MAEKIRIELSASINTGGGQQINTLELREPKLRDYQAFKHLRPGQSGAEMSVGDIMATAMTAAALLGGLTPGEAGDIAVADGMAIFEAVSLFFEPPRRTGPTA